MSTVIEMKGSKLTIEVTMVSGVTKEIIAESTLMNWGFGSSGNPYTVYEAMDLFKARVNNGILYQGISLSNIETYKILKTEELIHKVITEPYTEWFGLITRYAYSKQELL